MKGRGIITGWVFFRGRPLFLEAASIEDIVEASFLRSSDSILYSRSYLSNAIIFATVCSSCHVSPLGLYSF